jgi:hypothetical protein
MSHRYKSEAKPAYLWSPSWNMEMPVLYECLYRYGDIRNLVLFSFNFPHA